MFGTFYQLKSRISLSIKKDLNETNSTFSVSINEH